MKEKTICDNCHRSTLSHCSKPYKEDFVELVEQEEVRNSITDCDLYDKITTLQHIGEFFSGIGYMIYHKWLDVRKFIVHNVFGRIRFGFDTSDLWSLDYSITKFIYPRLKKFVEDGTQGYPSELDDKEFITKHKLKYLVGTEDKDTWNNILHKMLKTFEILHSDTYMHDTDDSKEIEEGLRLFSIFYSGLWD